MAKLEYHKNTQCTTQKLARALIFWGRVEEEEVDNYEESRMVVAKWWRWLELELALSAADVTTVEEGSDGSG